MNVYLFVDPRFRPLSLSGIIMPGAYLVFLDSETDIPTPAYADTIGTELANPLTADDSGRFVTIYLDGSVTYRIQLFDEDDVLQWDQDPYVPPRDFQPGTVLGFLGTAEERDAAYPPALWQVLDGNNGTPDSRDRYPIGASSTKLSGQTGGGNFATETGAAGEHDHTGDTGETVLDADDMPVHNHRLYVRTSSTQRGNTRGFGFASTAGVEGQIIDDAPYGYLDEAPAASGNKLIEATGTADPTGHTHTITEQADHTHSIEPGESPWFALWWVMRRNV
jgi:hypothetical protein